MANRLKRFRFIDLRIPLRGGLGFRIVERPGFGLPEPDQQVLLEELRSVADRCVPHERVRYGVLSGDRDRLERALVAIIYERDSGRAMGFNAMSMMEVTLGGRRVEVLHAGLIMIDPSFRSRGHSVLMSAAPAILAFVRNRLRPLWVTNVTQVPAVAALFTRSVEDAFPAPDRPAPPSETHAEVASRVMAHHRAVFGVGEDATFDTQDFVIRNSYTGGSDALKKTFEQCRKPRDTRFSELCAERLDYERGDDLLQVGRITPRFCLRLVGKLTRCVRLPNPFRGRLTRGSRPTQGSQPTVGSRPTRIDPTRAGRPARRGRPARARRYGPAPAELHEEAVR